MRSTTTDADSASASIFTTPKWPSSRRTHSLSSSSSSLSSSSDSLPPSPATPLPRYTAGGGIPFSWETLPGIPKNNHIILKKIDYEGFLPLPPAAAKNYNNCTATATGRGRDPFFAALVECSKSGDDEDESDEVDKDVFGSGRIWKGVLPKVGGRSLFMSCKNGSDISESLVFLPRREGRTTRRIG